MTLRERASAAGGAAALAASVLLIGGAVRWAQAIVAGLVALAVIPHLRSRRVLARPPALLAGLGAAFVLTALQLVPLPHALLDALQPVGTALRDEGAALAHVSPWQALTLDAPGSLRALPFFGVLLGVGWVALRLAINERGRYRILAAVAATGGLTAVIVGIHALLGATSLYGIYEPAQAHPKLLGPLLNGNHLGGFMAVCALVAAGLAMYPHQRSWKRVGWLLVVVACATTTAAGDSRGATLALLAGGFMLAVVLGAQRLLGEPQQGRRVRRTLTTSLPMVVVAACAVVVVVYASAGDVSGQLARTTADEIRAPMSKFAVWRSAEALFSEAPWFGVGRGAFESTITRVHPASAVSTFSHAENEYVQALVDWGLVGGVLLGAALLWIAVACLRRWRDGPLAAGALAAIGAIALQSIVDFGVEMLGVAVPVVAILATLTHVPIKESAGRRLQAARGGRVVLVLGLLAGVLVLCLPATRTNAEDHALLAARAETDHQVIADAIARHPLDYYGYAVDAQLMVRDGDPDAVRLLNHALRLHPLHAGSHHLAARMLVRSGHLEQAAVEYAATLRATPNPKPVVVEALAELPPELAAAAIPADLPNLDAMAKLLAELDAKAVSRRWLEHVLDLHPRSTQACKHLFDVIARSDDLEAALAANARCGEVVARDQRLALARMLVDKGRAAEAERAVADAEQWSGELRERVDGWLVLCDAQIGQARYDDAKRCLRRLQVIVPAERAGEIASRLAHIDELVRAQPTASQP